MYNKNYLIHYGVQGQKWGLRQWQNKDGSLTPAGREHYGYGDPKERKAEYKQAKKNYGRAVDDNTYNSIFFGRFLRSNGSAKKVGDAATDMYYKKADYKASKQKTAEKAEKVKMKELSKAFNNFGQPGSYNDLKNGGLGTIYYNNIKKDYGKDYAENLLDKHTKTTVNSLIAIGAVTTGLYITEAILESNYR